MSESRRPSRQEQITEKKKTPKIRLRLKKTKEYKSQAVWHFRNRAARDQAGDGGTVLRNSEQITRAVNAGQIDHKLVQAVPIRVQRTKITPIAARQPKQLLPLVLVPGRKLDEADWATHLLAIAQIADGRGWRQPSAKAKNWQSTSSVLQASQAAGLCEPDKFERSKRGKAKLQARNEAKAIFKLDRLIEQHPTRVLMAKTREQMMNWFVASVEETTEVDRDWLTNEVKERIKQGGRDPKFMHAANRPRSIELLEAA